ncbi:MAG: LysR substrate-binding domain-containing protein [Xanthobacteraceae bacterium]
MRYWHYRARSACGRLEDDRLFGRSSCRRFAGGHRFSKRGELRYANILDEELVALESGTATHRLLSSRASELGRPMRVRVQVRSFEVMCLLISQGLGIGILPELAARPLSKALDIRLVTLAENWARRDNAICVRAFENLEAPISRLIDFLTASAAKDAGSGAVVQKRERRNGRSRRL